MVTMRNISSSTPISSAINASSSALARTSWMRSQNFPSRVGVLWL
jgi:hypothetical protein